MPQFFFGGSWMVVDCDCDCDLDTYWN